MPFIIHWKICDLSFKIVGLLRCVLGQNTILSQLLPSPRNLNGYWKIVNKSWHNVGGGGEKEKNLWWGGEINNILHATETGWMGHLAWVQTLPTYPYIYFLIDISLPPRISSPYLSKNCRASLYFAPLSLSPSGLNHSRLRKLPVNSATEEKNMYFNVNKI